MLQVETRFQLDADKYIFLPAEHTLIIADPHFTKETHFRKHGIAIPPGLMQRDLKRVELAVAKYAAQRIIFLGDMFHSESNEAMNAFLQWRSKQTVAMDLVVGNHDILEKTWYSEADIRCFADVLHINELVLSHDRIEVGEEQYNLHGHIHPVAILSGKAKQSMRLPCFWFGKQHGVLPSFGTFTGGHAIAPAKNDKVFVIAEGKVIPLHN